MEQTSNLIKVAQESDENIKDQKNFQEKQISEQIDFALRKLEQQSTNTRANLNITQILSYLEVILENFSRVKNTITDHQSHTLYIQFHKFIKSKSTKQAKLSAESTSALYFKDEEKLSKIKQEVLEMLESAEDIYKQVFKESQKYVLWMDKKQNNNQKQLNILKDTYQNVNINYYINDEEFREDILRFKDHPLILIMSASSAGSNKEYGDGEHLNYVLSIKKDLRLRGIIIFCGKQGVPTMKKLQDNPDNMIYSVVLNEKTLLKKVRKLIVPLDFKRVVPLKHLDYFLSQQTKEKVLSWSTKDWSKCDILSYKDKRYDKIFLKAKNIIETKKIKIRQEIIDTMDSIQKAITQIFDKNGTKEDLYKDFIKLYTNQDQQCYSFINSVLNIMNDDLIFALLNFFSIFLISLSQYDDSKTTAIKKPETGLSPEATQIYEFYRGTSIPTTIINNNELIPEQFITLPSFSSFTTKIGVAKNFMNTQKKFGDCKFLLLSYKFQTGTKYYDLRPKCIKEISKFPDEDEYLMYPFTNFKIQSVKEEKAGRQNYFKVELSIN